MPTAEKILFPAIGKLGRFVTSLNISNNQKLANDTTFLERQYKLAIDAKDKLNDNYHKWMTFYYVANGAVLVAITSLFDESKDNHGTILFSLIGIFICSFWHLSCKGYYYWSNSWMNIIIDLEKKVTEKNYEALFVYSAFSQKVVDNETNTWLPHKPANISTPKLTLLFSFLSIVSWTIFAVYEFWIQCSSLCIFCVIIISFGIIIGMATIFILPRFVKSRQDDTHTLV